MNSAQFKKAIESVSDQIINYHETIHTRRVMSSEQPGYLKNLILDLPPEEGEAWEDIQKDMEAKIMPGMTHWNSPDFMAYFPAPTSYPSMLGELYSSSLAVSAFNWECAPAVTELEIIVMDWLVKMLNLPPCYLSSNTGGGVIQNTTSEAILSVMVAARERYLHTHTTDLSGHERDGVISHRRLRMVAIGSEAAHSCTQKAARILGIQYRSVPVDIEDGFSMTGTALAATLTRCQQEGLEPFYLTATLGTTATCAVDKFDEIAQVCKGQEIWVHVDAAYAGAALICEEYQHLTRYLGEFDSFSFSMSKWLLTNIDAVCCFLKNRHDMTDSMSITPSYLQNDSSDSGKVVDFRDWGVPLSRRFRALKIWFVIRTYGVKGLKSYIRNHVELSNTFASFVASRPDLFRVVTEPAFALTVLRVIPPQPRPTNAESAQNAKDAGMSYSFWRNGESRDIGHTINNGVASSHGVENGHIFVHENSDKDPNNSSFAAIRFSSNETAHTTAEPNPKQDLRTKEHYINSGNCVIGDKGFNGTSSECESDTDSAVTNGSLTTHRTTSNTSIASTSMQDSVEDCMTEYGNMITKEVCDLINRRGEIMITSTVIGGLLVIRVNGANPNTEEKHLRKAFEILVSTAEEVRNSA